MIKLKFPDMVLSEVISESNAKLEYVLMRVYAKDCNSTDDVLATDAVSELCDEELDVSGALLGRIRERAYARSEIE
jgi:hypothetical protein